MKLIKEDKELLLKNGYTEEDFPQIEVAMLKKNTKYELNDKLISREEAIAILGREKYVSGISRSAFHWSAVRQVKEGSDEELIYFDSSNLFRSK